MIRGRKIPQVSGMAGGLPPSNTRTGRAGLKNLEISKTARIQSSWSSGFECADTHASRAIPPTSLSETIKKPTAQIKSASVPALPNSGGAAAASIIIERSEWELGPAVIPCEARRAVAFRSVAEGHVGSSRVSKGKVSEPRIPEDHTRCRKAADRRRAAAAIIHAKPSKQVIFTEHAINSASDSSELRSTFMVSSPWGLL